MNLFILYLAPSGWAPHELGVFSSSVDVTVVGCHGLTMGIQQPYRLLLEQLDYTLWK